MAWHTRWRRIFGWETKTLNVVVENAQKTVDLVTWMCKYYLYEYPLWLFSLICRDLYPSPNRINQYMQISVKKIISHFVFYVPFRVLNAPHKECVSQQLLLRGNTLFLSPLRVFCYYIFEQNGARYWYLLLSPPRAFPSDMNIYLHS